jgi:hypothetical protein
MISTSTLTGALLRTYNTILQEQDSHNVGWQEIHALLQQLAQVSDETNGDLKVTRHGQIMVLHAPRKKNAFEPNEILALRHFLERSEMPAPETNGRDPHMLLVIDHHEARLFRSEVNGGIPHQILPHTPNDFFWHAQNPENSSKGNETRTVNDFFKHVAEALQAAGQILIFGTDTSKEIDRFIAWLNLHCPEIAGRIIGSLVVEVDLLDEGRLLEKAQEFYAHHLTPPMQAVCI